ncbi:MAG TPA: hypothetical protein VEU96_10955 [Bryobacteraceae bacterium]|nr:hypothetical protein [Bryobacteraceae bacterium]
MNRTAKEFARKIVSELESIRRLIVDAISHPGKQADGCEEQHGKPNSDAQTSPEGRRTSTSNADPSVTSNNPPTKAKQERFPGLTEWKPLIEIVGVGFLVIYTAVTIFLWCEARTANKISRSSLAATQRPWVSIDAAIGGPFVFDENGAHVTIYFVLKNTGLSAATGVVFYPELYILGPTKQMAFKERERLCKEIVKQGHFEETIFAGEKRTPQRWTLSALKADMEKSALPIVVAPFGKVIGTAIVACVAYRSTVSNETYYTGHSYDLITSSGTAIWYSENVPADKLVLFDDPISAVIAH